MGAPLREPRAPRTPNGGRQESYTLTDLGDLVPSTRKFGNTSESWFDKELFQRHPDHDEFSVFHAAKNSGAVGKSAIPPITPPMSPGTERIEDKTGFSSERSHDKADLQARIETRSSKQESGSQVGSQVRRQGKETSSESFNESSGERHGPMNMYPTISTMQTLSVERINAKNTDSNRTSSGTTDRIKIPSPSTSFRTLHASAKGLLRTHPIASEQQLFEAFCGMKIRSQKQNTGRVSRASKAFASASSVNTQSDEPLDWVIAIAVPAPGVRKMQLNITEDHAEAIFRTCFKGEEYEQSATAFSLQSEAAAAELRSFMRAFNELPQADSKGNKSMNVGRRMSRDMQEDLQKSTSASEVGDGEGEDEAQKKVPRSFTCLVRNAIVTKLVLHCGLRVKLIPSEDHQQVILLISCSHYELLREADRQSLPTELDVHAADPESLEPCTETMIPLLYWFHSAQRQEEKDREIQEALSLLMEKRRAELERIPQKAQQFHQNSTEFWETLRGFADFENSLQAVKRSFKNSNESLTHSLSRNGSWNKDDADPIPHFGSRVKANQAKEAFLMYMKAKISEPLGMPREIQKQVNKTQHLKGHVELRNYYEQLGVQEISAHAGFEVGTYFGAGAATQCLWRHFSVRVNPPQPNRENQPKQRVYEKHIATPFRNHQIIKLIVDIISRQMDIGRLIDLGLVNSMFPLDSRDKVEEPEQWVVASEEPDGREYWFNVDTKKVSLETPPEVEDGSHHRPSSSLIKAWGYPPKDLPTCKRAWIFFHSFFIWPSIQSVRDYYGEEIALYFALTQHLTIWCIVPAVLGVFTGIMEALYEGKIPLAYIHLGYGILISCWGSLWLESWKRKEAVLAATWGLLGISEQEVLRPAFEGVSRRSPIDFDNDMDRVEAFCCRYGRVGRFPRQIASAACLFFMALVHNVLMVLLLTFRGTWVERGWSLVQYSNLVVASCFAVQMTLFSFILYRACVVLNRWENYRTHADYTKAFIIKQCGLEFVNQFAIFFYIGLMKGAVDGCIIVDQATDNLVRTPKVDISSLDNIEQAMCSQELRDAVQNVLLAFAFMNVVEITLPAFILPKLRATIKDLMSNEADPELKRRGTAEEQRFVGWTMSKIVQAMLNKEVYSTVEASGTYDDYIEVMVFFGHVSMFSLVFPFCPLIVLILLVIEIRVDGHKLFHTLRRPLPKNAGSIGAWHYIFQFITWVSVITNALILCWGMEDDEMHWLKSSTTAAKWLFAVCLALGLVIFKAVIIVGVPDIPGPLKTLLLHHDWVCQQLSSNNVAIGPRQLDVAKLDTHIHSAFSEQRTFSVDFAVTNSDFSNSPRDNGHWFGRV